MDSELRKQKRLGPAPIASFEKSFEDNTGNAYGSSTTVPTTIPTTIITATSFDQAQEMESGTSPKTDPTEVGQKTGVVGKESTGAGPAQATASAGATTSTKPTTTTASPLSRRSQEAGSGISGRTRPPPLHVSVQVTGSGEPGSQAACSSATLGVHTPSTPRIDISRASSSSHHEDSRDSSPENVFEQVGTGTLQEAIGLGFREEGALELRSSTEELYFMDPEQKKEEQEKLQQARKSPVIFKFDEHQTYLQQHQRKDSASSEVAALLCISGRTSRISSVGSQGSAVSRLSAVSGVSRSPSPHRMLLETSFCGPKPLENVIDGSIVSSAEPPTAETLEQVLLSRKHDPTQAVFAEGIKIESSPKKQLTNGQKKSKTLAAEKPVEKRIVKPASATSSSAGSKSLGRQGLTIPKKDAAKPIVGVTPSGTQYIRIKLKPDHMYQDKGLAPNERVVEAAVSGSQKKPASLSLGREITTSEQRLTPSSSPKPARHQALAREVSGSRSPSPATVAMSRKSSFCSLFKAKDSPDSPRDRSRSRSKSRDRSTPQSQTGTPNKQKSVLAIFKPKRSGSKSKSSSPIDQDTIAQLDGISQVEFKFKSDQPETKSRPSSRLKYYDTPLDGKSIHIPLHTPPDEKESKGFVSARAKESEAISNLPSANPEPKPGPSSALHSGESSSVSFAGPAPALPQKSPKPLQVEKLQRIENLDAIHSLPQEMDDRERTWSLDVQRHSSQDSQETMSLENSLPSSRRISKPNLSEVIESPVKENGILPPKAQTVTTQQSQQQIQQHQQVHSVVQPSQPIQTPTGIQPSVPTSREKRRLMFATRIGSGSEEQIFSTQFSLSKTESLSSQLSEQTSIPDSPAVDSREQLHRSDTVIRRPDEASGTQSGVGKRPSKQSSEESGPTEICRAVELEGCAAIPKKDSSDDIKRKSKSTSEDDEKRPLAIVTMRKKDSSEEGKRKSKSNSEEDDPTHRHSKYLENFDVRKKFPESKRQSSRNSSDSSIKERDSRTSSHEDGDYNLPASTAAATSSKQAKQRLHHTSPNPCHLQPQQQSERQSIASTDEPAESSESERDSEMESNRIKRHLPRHIGAIEDHESTGLVSQDSFEDELPYVPTTLPEERAHGISLIPMKERINMELKTCPVDRPRSTTPMNPACLEEYCGIVTPDDTDHTPVRGEKLRISLPRKDSTKEKAQKTKSPRQLANTSGKSWFEFAEQGIRGGTTTTTSAGTPTQVTSERERRGSSQDEEPPPPLPPRKPSQPSGQWINFENIPEKRKPPKRITALPKDSLQDPKPSPQPPIQYNYVKPEECQCECHEVERESGVHKSIASVDLLQQGEDTQPLLEAESQEGIDPSDSSVDYSYGADIPETAEQKPFEMDLSLGLPGSNRSSLHSQDPESPDRQPTANDSTISKGRQRPSDYRNP